MRRVREVLVKHFLVLVACCVFSSISAAQTASEWLAGLPQTKDYVQKRASSYDRSGGNADYRKIAPGDTLVLIDETGPGEITHFWTTMWADGQALKAFVLRMYWDEEKTPSVEYIFPDAVSKACTHHFDERRRKRSPQLLLQY